MLLSNLQILKNKKKKKCFREGFSSTGPGTLTLSQTSPWFYMSAGQVFWKHCGKRRNCSSRAISPFPTVFSTHLENFLPFSSNLKLSSASALNLEECKVCRLGNGLRRWETARGGDAGARRGGGKICLIGSSFFARPRYSWGIKDIHCITVQYSLTLFLVTMTVSTSLKFNSWPNDKILDVTKLKAFADDKLNIARVAISLFNRVKNTVGEKGENAGYQHFLLFLQRFPKRSS